MTKEQENRVTGFLGLCMRAGQVQSGQEACVELIRAGNARLALLDTGAAPNTLKRVRDACAAHQVPLYELSAGALGACIGKRERMVLALGAGGMTDKLLQMLRQE